MLNPTQKIAFILDVVQNVLLRLVWKKKLSDLKLKLFLCLTFKMYAERIVKPRALIGVDCIAQTLLDLDYLRCTLGPLKKLMKCMVCLILNHETLSHSGLKQWSVNLRRVEISCRIFIEKAHWSDVIIGFEICYCIDFPQVQRVTVEGNGAQFSCADDL